MSYDPTNWKAGDVISSQKLNKLEQGVADAGGGGGALICTLTEQEDTPSEGKTTYSLDKTAREIIEAMPLVYIKVDETSEAGTIHEYVLSSSGTPPYSASYLESENGYAFLTGGLVVAPLLAPTLDDYPTFVDQGGN